MISTLLNVNYGHCLRPVFTNSGGSQLRRPRGFRRLTQIMSVGSRYSERRKCPIDLDKVTQISSPILKTLPQWESQISLILWFQILEIFLAESFFGIQALRKLFHSVNLIIVFNAEAIEVSFRKWVNLLVTMWQKTDTFFATSRILTT